jgi:ATP-dependent helicase HrpB
VRDLPHLPVTPLLPEVESALADPGRAVLVAPPGAGKTTLVPLALLDAPWLEERKLILLEPRRLAARAAARRMAHLLGESDAGGTVGYRIRMETRVGPRTRIEVVTEGVLTRMLQSDPTLQGVGALLFDEFHERSLAAELGLALALQAADLFREDLRLLVMSATLDAEPVGALLGEGASAPILRSEGRDFPVETRWRERPVEGWIEPAVIGTVQRALEETEGDLLVFLPGAGEIRRVERGLRDGGLPHGVRIHPLFGALSREAQDEALSIAPPGIRKVVLATAIAETSLTIEGVRVVVDAGRMRVPRFDPGTGMTRLETVRVTRDAAEQRRGRAGRTAPGVCYRLWTRGEERGLVPHRIPEIREADLAPLALELAVWGAESRDLRWLEPPPEGALSQARDLLEALEILDPEGGITPHGRDVSRMGLHPRIGHMLVRGGELGLGPLASDVAAILGDRDLIRGDGRASDADLRLRVELLRRHRRGRRGGPGLPGHQVDRGGVARALKESRHLRRVLGVPVSDSGSDAGTDSGSGPGAGTDAGTRGRDEWEELDEVGLLVALAYPDRIGRRRPGARGRFLLRNGRGARFAESQSLEGAEWLVAAEVEGSGREARIFRAAALEEEAVERHWGPFIQEDREVAWDADAGRVRARRVRRLGAIVLSSGRLTDSDPTEVAAALLEGLRFEAGGGRVLHALPWSRETEQLRQRLHFLHHLDPDRWRPASMEALVEDMEEWLLPFVSGMRSLDDLSRVDLREALLSPLSWEDRSLLDQWAPTHLEVPSGSRIALDYSDPEAPVLAVRLQEVFGLTETPRIGGGRVPLTLHLLSPARRPVQVTRDLESFWREGYFQVRKDLRGRYPKHYWPEDPHDAQATRRVRPR